MARATAVAPARGGATSGWAPMDVYRAEALAVALHRGQRDAGGALLIDHIRRVAGAVPPEDAAPPVAPGLPRPAAVHPSRR